MILLIWSIYVISSGKYQLAKNYGVTGGAARLCGAYNLLISLGLVGAAIPIENRMLNVGVQIALIVAVGLLAVAIHGNDFKKPADGGIADPEQRPQATKVDMAYDIYRKAEKIIAVKNGFNWAAFIFGVFWAGSIGMLKRTIILLYIGVSLSAVYFSLVYVFLYLISDDPVFHVSIFDLIFVIGYRIWVGLNANIWVKEYLLQKEFDLAKSNVRGASKSEAISLMNKPNWDEALTMGSSFSHPIIRFDGHYCTYFIWISTLGVKYMKHFCEEEDAVSYIDNNPNKIYVEN